MTRRTPEAGFAAVELVAGIAVLVVPVVLLVASIPEWSARQSLARLAAREASRAVALEGICRGSVAESVVEAVEQGSGAPDGALTVGLDCAPGAALARGSTVTARVTVSMPAIVVPLIGTAAGWSWTAAHREPVDPYRSLP